jgi:hypothetical protein
VQVIPISGGSNDGMPSWADFMKQMEAEGEPAPVQPKK